MMGGILVWSEQPGLQLELVSEARRVADAAGLEVAAVYFAAAAGDRSGALAEAGADRTFSANLGRVDADSSVDGLMAAIDRVEPALVLVGASKLGMDVAPRVAERRAAGYGAWAVGFSVDQSSGAVAATCEIYAGVGLATYAFGPAITVLSCAQGVFERRKIAGRTVDHEQLEVPESTPRLSHVGDSPKHAARELLGDARAVVDIGQGVKEREDLELVRSFADLLDAKLACTRPVSSTRDWFSEWLGLSGAKISPDLCVTLGVSGAIQHMIGVRGSRVIAAINNDEDAGIFLQADVGVVADLYEFLPVLVDRMRARGICPVAD